MLEDARRLLAPPGKCLKEVAVATLSRELELRAASADSGLSRLEVRYAGFPLRLLLALPVSEHLDWHGDRQLTLATNHHKFTSADLALNLESVGWSWDADRDAGRKGGRRRRRLEQDKEYFIVTDPPADKVGWVAITYNLQARVLVLKTPVMRFSSGFRQLAGRGCREQHRILHQHRWTRCMTILFGHTMVELL